MADCSICLLPIVDSEKFTLPCNHVYHEPCIAMNVVHTNTTCPECRQKISWDVQKTLCERNKKIFYDGLVLSMRKKLNAVMERVAIIEQLSEAMEPGDTLAIVCISENS